MIKKATAQDAFRVIMNPENAHLFKQGADGYWKPYLREANRFVENVDLEKIPPDRLTAVSDILFLVNMAAMAADISAIRIGIDNLQSLISETTRGQVKGNLAVINSIKDLNDPNERRREMLAASRNLAASLGALVGQLKAHVAAMPEPRTGIMDGFFESGLDDADSKYHEVMADIWMLRDGLAALLQSYAGLGEASVARAMLSEISKAMKEARLDEAIRKARLVRIPKGGEPPENAPRAFNMALLQIETRLAAVGTSDQFAISVDLTSEELHQ
jgi:hypothetical protein